MFHALARPLFRFVPDGTTIRFMNGRFAGCWFRRFSPPLR